MLCLISPPVLAQTQTLTADDASVKKLAKELFVCSSFFALVSMCFEDKNLTSGLNPQDKKHVADLSRAYKNQAVKTSNNAAQFAASTDMPLDELLSASSNSTKGWMAEIGGDCRKIAILSDKNFPACKWLVEQPALRLKKISECSHEKKEGC